MKRVLVLCSMLSLLIGCSSDFEETNQMPADGTTESGLPTVISASVPESEEKEDSRTYVVRDQHVLWHNGDDIAYFAGVTKAKYTYNGYNGVTTASLDLVEESGISRILYTNAVYPHDAALGCTFNGSEDQLSVNYPAEQAYANNSFGKGANVMVYMGTTPYGKDKSINFRNACGYFTIKLYSSKNKPVAIKSIKLTALGSEKIAGPATIVADSNGIPQITMSSEGTSEVTLNCGNSGKVISNDVEHPTEFWFALPPTTFNSGVRVEVVDVEGTTYIKQTDKKVVVERNKIKPMAAFKFAYPTDNQLWYTRHSDSLELMEFYDDMENLFDAQMTDHYYDKDNKLFVIEFDAPLKVIKEQAFESYGLHKVASRDMASIYLPEQLTTIEEEAFYDSGITEFVVPGSVNYIGEDNFISCEKLRSVIFYPSPTNTPLEMAITSSIGDDQGQFAFNGAISLSYIYVDRDIFLTKGGEPFTPDNSNEGIFSCSNSAPVGTVVIGEQLPEIYPYMFNGCSIDNVEIPAHITKIGEGAFGQCRKLTSITIPKTVKSIGVDAFYNTTSLKSVIIEDSDEPLQLGRACSFTGEDRGTFYYSPLSNIYLGRDIDYRDEDGTFDPNAWDEGVFTTDYYDNEELKTEVTISNNVTKIPELMFSRVRMEEITIPASVKTIENDAFYDTSSLHTVIIEDSDEPLQLGISYGGEAGTIQRGAFYFSPLKKIYLGRDIDYRDGGEPFDPNTWDEGVFACKNYDNEELKTEVTISNNVTKILESMFSGARLENVTIPESVKTIEDDAFEFCHVLKDVKCESATPPTLGTGVFNDCGALDKIYVPASAVTIYKNAANWSDYEDSIVGY